MSSTISADYTRAQRTDEVIRAHKVKKKKKT